MHSMSFKRAALGIVGALAATAAATAAGGEERFRSAPAAQHIVVKGDSTLHAWSVDTETIAGELVLGGDPEKPLAERAPLVSRDEHPTLSVTIPAKSLAGEKDGLNEKMYTALKAEDHARIRYRLTAAHGAKAVEGGDAVRVNTRGVVTVAGEDHGLSTPMMIERLGPTRLRVSGRAALKMTDFGIEPPSAMLGMISAADKVEVQWRWTVVAANAPAVDDRTLRGWASRLLASYDRARERLHQGQVGGARARLERLAGRAKGVAERAAEAESEAAGAFAKAARSLAKSARAAAEAGGVSATRDAFQAVSEGLRGIVERFGHAQSRPVFSVRCAATGIGHPEDREWLELSPPLGCPYLAPGERVEPEGTAIRMLRGRPQRGGEGR